MEPFGVARGLQHHHFYLHSIHAAADRLHVLLLLLLSDKILFAGINKHPPTRDASADKLASIQFD